MIMINKNQKIVTEWLPSDWPSHSQQWLMLGKTLRRSYLGFHWWSSGDKFELPLQGGVGSIPTQTIKIPHE